MPLHVAGELPLLVVDLYLVVSIQGVTFSILQKSTNRSTPMTSADVFNIIVGVIGILSFVFSLWVWVRSDMKIRELSGVIETIHDIAGSAIWEFQMTLAADYEIRLRQAEKTLGFISGIRKLTGRYATRKTRLKGESGLDQLIERGIVWNMAMLMDFELSKGITEIWIVTSDLKPDSAEETVGKLVYENLRRGRRYIYFYPDDLPYIETETASLLKNIGLMNSQKKKLRKQVTLVPLSRVQHARLFAGGNIVLYYLDEHRSLPPRCFEEVVLTQVPERGVFWQEHAEARSKELRHLLGTEVQRFLESKTAGEDLPFTG